jgi:cyanate permease
MNVESKQTYRWVILIQAWLIYVSFGLIYTTLSAIVTPVMNDLNLSFSQMGFILGSWQLVYTVVALPLGFLTDRIGPYKSLLLATSLIAVSAVLRSFAVSFETLTAFVAFFGVGGSMISIGLPKLASQWFLGRERGTAAGIYGTGPTIGSILALSLTNSIVIPLVGNWRNAFIAYGLVGFLISAIWLFLGRRSPNSSQPKVASTSGETQGFSGVKEVFKSRNVWLVVIIGITAFLTGHGLANWLPKILETRGLTVTEAGLAMSLQNSIGIFWSLIVPRLPYYLGSKKKALSIVLFVQGILILALGIAEGPFLWLVMALGGISRGLLPMLMVTLMDLPEVGPTRMGVVGGLYFAIGEIGGFGGPFITGLLKDVTGTFISGMIFLAAVCLATIFLTPFLKIDTKPQKTQ